MWYIGISVNWYSKLVRERENIWQIQKKSSSLEQQRAEDEIFCMVEDWLGCKYSIIGEIFAHIGGNKRGQSTKIANDILKMLLLEKDRCKSFRKIIVVCDEQEERTLSGKSALAESIRQFGIELKRVEIADELRETILSAQNRQVMINW